MAHAPSAPGLSCTRTSTCAGERHRGLLDRLSWAMTKLSAMSMLFESLGMCMVMADWAWACYTPWRPSSRHRIHTRICWVESPPRQVVIGPGGRRLLENREMQHGTLTPVGRRASRTIVHRADHPAGVFTIGDYPMGDHATYHWTGQDRTDLSILEGSRRLSGKPFIRSQSSMRRPMRD